MSLADEYKRQFAWRDWKTVLDALPSLDGQAILDFGCGPGDVAAALSERGARVTGVDLNEELLREARSRGLPHSRFLLGDVRTIVDPSGVPLDFGGPADGLWSSFAAAYIPDLSATLSAWRNLLNPIGWIALTEVDDLFGHLPMGTRTSSLFQNYARDSLAAGRYDFHMGRKLRSFLEASGFAILNELKLKDQELSFHGPATPDILEAWSRRLERMKLLQEFCGQEFETLRDELLATLADPGHTALAQVNCCIATKR